MAYMLWIYFIVQNKKKSPITSWDNCTISNPVLLFSYLESINEMINHNYCFTGSWWLDWQRGPLWYSTLTSTAGIMSSSNATKSVTPIFIHMTPSIHTHTPTPTHLNTHKNEDEWNIMHKVIPAASITRLKWCSILYCTRQLKLRVSKKCSKLHTCHEVQRAHWANCSCVLYIYEYNIYILVS